MTLEKKNSDDKSSTPSLDVEKITLLKHPILTLQYFSVVAGIFVKDTLLFLKNHKLFTQIFIPLVIILVSLYFIPGAHQPVVRSSEEAILFALWWIGLGVLSSIGLGTGLHTFVLYLGPHIAKVAMTATECNSIDFDTYGEDSFLCPTVATASTVTLWSIIHKVQLESFLWGAGTAIGELPPYFVARAARLSGKELQEFEELKDQHTIMNRAKAFALQILENFGFFGILIFASIPNPLFDLAGLVCGHFLIPFMTFFGATLIGKAVIKVHLQMIFVIILFHKETIDKVVYYVEQLVPSLKGGLHHLLETERKKLHEPHHHAHGENKSVFGYIWNLLIAVMIGYFVVSLIDSSVQNHLSSQQPKEKLLEKDSAEKKKKSKKNKTGTGKN